MTQHHPPPNVRASYATADPFEAREFVEEAYGARIRVGSIRDRRFRVSLERVRCGDVELADLDLPMDLRMMIVGRGDYVFSTVIDGTATYERRSDETRLTRGDTYVAIRPVGEDPARTEHLHVRTISLPAAVLDAVAAAAGADAAAWEFTAMRPITGGARRFRRTLAGVRELLDGLGDDPAPLVTGPAARLMAATALAVFPNTAVAPFEATDRAGDAHPDALRRAIAYIDANPDLDLTLADVARAAFVSPRACSSRSAVTSTPRRWPTSGRSDWRARATLCGGPTRSRASPSRGSRPSGGSLTRAASPSSTAPPTASRRAARCRRRTPRRASERHRRTWTRRLPSGVAPRATAILAVDRGPAPRRPRRAQGRDHERRRGDVHRPADLLLPLVLRLLQRVPDPVHATALSAARGRAQTSGWNRPSWSK